MHGEGPLAQAPPTIHETALMTIHHVACERCRRSSSHCSAGMEISDATPSTGMTPTMAAIGQLATPSVDGAIPRGTRWPLRFAGMTDGAWHDAMATNPALARELRPSGRTGCPIEHLIEAERMGLECRGTRTTP